MTDPPATPPVVRERRTRPALSMAAMRALVRPAVTLLFSIGVVVGFFGGRLNSDQFLSIATVVISFWYASRSEEKANQGG